MDHGCHLDQLFTGCPVVVTVYHNSSYKLQRCKTHCDLDRDKSMHASCRYAVWQNGLLVFRDADSNGVISVAFSVQKKIKNFENRKTCT